jgi:hypothetical protein
MATGTTRKLHGHVVDHDYQRIDPRRRVKRAGQVHRDHCEANRQRRSPRHRPAELDDQQPNERREKVAAN